MLLIINDENQGLFKINSTLVWVISGKSNIILFSFYHVYIFQTSVYCLDSLDGVPFILHDSTFLRTTNIEKVFPSLKDEDASNFNMSQIKQLNAGLWFMEVTCHLLLSLFSSS